MSYIKGFTIELSVQGFYAEPIIFRKPDGIYKYTGWNLLLTEDSRGTHLDRISVQDAHNVYKFTSIRLIEQIDTEQLYFADNLTVNP